MKLNAFAQCMLIATGLVLTAPMALAESELAASTIRPPGYKPAKGNPKAGKALFNDTTLSTNGMSCASCHANHAAFSASFAQPYPHVVAMARDQLGRKRVHLDEMIQACMVMPMSAKPLPWNSKELADLTAYTAELQKTFKPAH
jgi:cytochrome c